MNVSSWIPVEVFLLLAASSLAQVDQAELLFNNADTFMAAGKYDEALDDYQKILELEPSSPWAAKALLKIGQYYAEVEGDTDKALIYYDRVQTQHGHDQESAPAAYYEMAVILDMKAKNHGELEDAVADLMRMNNIYQDNPYEDGGLFLVGKISMRLGEYNRSLSSFQRLEFAHPASPFVAKGLLESARVAYFTGHEKRASLILARLQSRHPQTEEAKLAERDLRLLDKFSQANLVFQLDRSFVGSMPKKYDDPYSVAVAKDDLVGILDDKTFHFIHKTPLTGVAAPPAKDTVGLCVDINRNLVFVQESQLTDLRGRIVFSGLSSSEGKSIHRISSAAIDNLGRLAIIDDDEKDVLVYDRQGDYLRSLKINRPELVRCFQDRFYVVPKNESDIIKIDSKLTGKTTLPTGLNQIEDFCLDRYGHIYVLSSKGHQLTIFDLDGHRRANINLKSGGYPLKEAHALAVDRAGAVYLVDRRGGAVYRFY